MIFDFENPPDPMTDDYFETHNPLYKFIFNFIKSGYLPKYLPVVASYGRWHKDARNFKWPLFFKEIGKKYYDPRGKNLSQLLEQIKSNNFRKQTLSGCIIEKIKNSLIIYQENRKKR